MSAKINSAQKQIIVEIPLTSPTGKIRIKSRSVIFEYGIPYATRQKPFTQNNYVEWQISYNTDNKNDSTPPHKTFKSYNGKTKTFYELSEYLYYFTKWELIEKTELKNLFNYLSKIKENNLIDRHKDCKIKRTHPIEKRINNINFFELKLEYPQLIHKFDKYEIITEITIREKQRAIGGTAHAIFLFSYNGT